MSTLEHFHWTQNNSHDVKYILIFFFLSRVYTWAHENNRSKHRLIIFNDRSPPSPIAYRSNLVENSEYENTRTIARESENGWKLEARKRFKTLHEKKKNRDSELSNVSNDFWRVYKQWRNYADYLEIETRSILNRQNWIR